MKKLFKNLGLSLAAFACLLCAGFGAVTLVSNSVSADAAIAASDYYVNGAGVRLVNDADGAGLRFHTRITTAEYGELGSFESGTLIIPEIRYDGELTLEDLDNGEATRPLNIETTGKWYQAEKDKTEGFMRSTVYMYDMPQVAFGARYYARSYVKVGETVTYSALSPAISMSDIAISVTNNDNKYTDLTQAQVQPYLIDKVSVTFDLPSGKVTKEFAYGETIVDDGVYNKNLYTATWTDQYGRTLEMGSAQATLPVTLTPVFGAAQETKTILKHAWRTDGNYPLSVSQEPAPVGFESVHEFDWLNAENGKFAGSKDFPAGNLDTADLSKYTDVYFAMKAVNYNSWYIRYCSTYSGEDWLYFHLQQADDGTWALNASTADGTYTATQTAISGTNLKEIMQYVSGGVGCGAYPTRTNMLDAATMVYFTEVIASGYKDLTGKPAAEATEVSSSALNYNWTYGVNTQKAVTALPALLNESDADYDVADGFSKVSKITSSTGWTSSIIGGGAFSEIDLSNYEEVWYALKVVNGKITNTQGGWKDITTVGENAWVYFHLTQTADSVWTIEVIKNDATVLTLENQIPAANTASNVSQLMDNHSNETQKGRLNIYHSGSGTAEIYASEILGVLKDGASGETPDVEEAFIPEDAETILHYFWREDRHALSSSTDETAPAGFTNVVEFNWLDNSANWQETGTDFGLGCVPTTDISGYSDVYFGVKLEGGNGIYIRGTNSYTGGQWLYAHYAQANDGTWSLSVKSEDGAFVRENVQTGLVGNNLQTLMSYGGNPARGFYPTKTAENTTAIIYFTELLAKGGAKDVWGERVIWSAADNWKPTEDHVVIPAGFTSLFKVENFEKDGFAKLDLGTDYSQLRFGMSATKNFGFNAGYGYVKDGAEKFTTIMSQVHNWHKMNLVTLTKTAEGWHVAIECKRWYDGGGQTTETFECDVTGVNSLSAIMATIINPSYNDVTLYVTEVRGLTHDHVADNYVSTGDGTHQGYCWCGVAVGEPIACSGGDATCTQKAICDLCGGEHGDFAAHVVVDDVGDGLACKICGNAAVETTVIANSAVIDSAANAHLTLSTNAAGVTAPAGFTTVTNLFSASGNTWSSKTLAPADFATANLNAYKEVWFAIMLENGHITQTAPAWTDIDSDLLSVWVRFHLIKEAENTWTVEIYKGDTYWGKQTAQTGKDIGAIFNTSTDNGRIVVYQKTDGTNSNADVNVYATEVRGIFDTGISPNATQIWQHIWNPYYFEGGGAAEGVWSDEPAPQGFSKVSEYTFSAKDLGYKWGHFNAADISVYSDLYFAMKCVGEEGYVYIQGAANSGYFGGGWVYVHYHQNANGTWTKSFRTVDGFYDNTAQTSGNITGTMLKDMFGWKSGVNQGAHPNTTAGVEATAYFTDVLAVLKCDGSNHTAYSYTSNGDGTHTVTCSCGAVINATAACDGTATCTQKATCSLCGAQHGDLNASNHATTMTTYVSNGNDTHSKIAACCNAVIATESCYGGSATCGTRATCDVCGELYGSTSGEHTSDEYYYLSNGNGTHRKMHACCDTVALTENCSGEPTCAQKAVCDLCGGEHGELLSHSNLKWDENNYVCGVCGNVIGSVDTQIAQQTVSLGTDAASVAELSTQMEIDLSGVTNLAISAIKDLNLGTYVSFSNNVMTVADIDPTEVFGEQTLTFTATIEGKDFEITAPVLVVTNTITTDEGMQSMRNLLRGKTDVVKGKAYQGGTGGVGTMNGDGYYLLGNDITLTSNGGGVSFTDGVGIAVYVWGTPHKYTYDANGAVTSVTRGVPFVGTFDGNGHKLESFCLTNWFSQTTTELFEGSDGQYLEGSLFGCVDGTIKNLSLTAVRLGIHANIVHSGSGSLENVYVQISDVQANSNVYESPFFGRDDNVLATMRNVVFDYKNMNSAIINSYVSSGAKPGSHFVTATGEKFIAENVAVYGFNKAWINGDRGNIYQDKTNAVTDGSAAGIYVEYTDGTTNGAQFSYAALDNNTWKLVNGVPMLVGLNASGTVTNPSDKYEEQDVNALDAYIVNGGTTEYYIDWSSAAGAYKAAQFIKDTMQQSTGATLSVGAADPENEAKKQIIVGTYAQYWDYVEGHDSVSLAAEANYGIYLENRTIYVLAEDEQSFHYAALALCRELFGYTELTANSVSMNQVSQLALADFSFAYTSNVTFAVRGGANNLPENTMGFSNWQAQPYVDYIAMHNALDYLDSYTGSDKSKMLATDSDSVLDNNSTAGEQVCYLARGNATSFNNFVNHVAGVILAKAQLNPTMKAINFMLEDNKDYCACEACAKFANPSVPQLIFLNELAAKLASEAYVNELGRVLSVEFFSYNSYASAPILEEGEETKLSELITSLGLTNQAITEFTYADMNKGLATYTAATDTTTKYVLKAADNLRLWWTSHEASHSFGLTHEANDHMYLALLGWIASMGTPEHIDVFMYQTAYRDYFIPLNTWQYQVEWYQMLNKLGIDNYMYNLGDVHNPATSQTGFSSFKTYIDSRAMTDSSVSFEQLKQEFFSTNGYYGAAGPTMRTFFEELVSVLNAKKQGENLAIDDYIDGSQLNYVNTTDAQWAQSFFNGYYGFSKTSIVFTGKSASGSTCTVTPSANVFKYGNLTQLATLVRWYKYCQTALGLVEDGSVYETRINVEALFPEYAILLLNSTYKSSIKYNSLSKDWYSISVTATFNGSSIHSNTSTAYQDFYDKVIALGYEKPCEFYFFNDGSTINSLGDQGTYTFGIYENSFKNWGVTF